MAHFETTERAVFCFRRHFLASCQSPLKLGNDTKHCILLLQTTIVS